MPKESLETIVISSIIGTVTLVFLLLVAIKLDVDVSPFYIFFAIPPIALIIWIIAKLLGIGSGESRGA